MTMPHINKIIISDKPTIGKTVFHQKEGIPIKISIDCFLGTSIECKHKVIHEFKIPIKSSIEWKIVNGTRDGAFKHGFGANAKYSDNKNDDCVIYYHPLNDVDKRKNQIIEILILIKIKSKKIDKTSIKIPYYKIRTMSITLVCMIMIIIINFF